MSLLLALLLSQVRVLDEGVTKGMASQVNCTGTGVTCTVNPTGVIWTLNVPGGGGGSGSPGGVAGNLQINDGAGGFGPYVLQACGAGSYVSAVSASGALTCSTPTATMNLTIPVYTRAAVPACGSTWLSKEIRVHDASQEDQTWLCEFDALGAYQWAIYSQAPDTTVFGTMAGGAQFVTVGGTFSHTDPGGAQGCVMALDSTQVGPAVSSGCIRITADWCGAGCTGYYMVGAHYVAVGSTVKFNRVRFSVSGTIWPIENVPIDTDGAPPFTANTAAGARVASITEPYPLASWPVGWTTGGSAPAFVTPTIWGTYGTKVFDRLAAPRTQWFGTNQFTSGGDLKFTLDSSVRAAWTIGWNATLGPSPSGVTASNYYWVLYTYDGYYSATWVGNQNNAWQYGEDYMWSQTAKGAIPVFTVTAQGVWDD